MLHRVSARWLTILPLVFTAPGLTAQSAVSNIRYEIRFDRVLARQRLLHVTMAFDAPPEATVLLSMPAWTPGSYEISNFARHIRAFSAFGPDGDALPWDKADPDTWRVRTGAGGGQRVEFDVFADALDNAMSWARDDFLLVNGTNALPYPEGLGMDFRATVTVRTESDWRVATGMHPAGGGGQFGETTYHDLVDMPMFIGQFDLDSVVVDGRPYRLATYPARTLTGAARQLLLTQIRDVMPPMARVFGETPWRHYSVLLIFDQGYGGGSALEHQNSHVGIYNPGFIGTSILASITAHEIFHGWNVKRMRPADLYPYRYDGPQPTEWLWVSEGITDYYADLALARGGVVDSAGLLDLWSEKLMETNAAPPVALEDASLSTWIHPTDGTGYLYYPKGALAGLALDIMIRDATANARSLDDVMRVVYQRSWKADRGFTGEDWWGAVREAAGPGAEAALTSFAARQIDGREPFPWSALLPRAGLRLVADTVREPRIGVSTSTDAGTTLVLEVVPGSSADAAGIGAGDFLLAAGDVPVTDESFGVRFRARYAGEAEGAAITYVVRRGERELHLPGTLRFEGESIARFEVDPSAGPAARRVRAGLFSGG